MEIRSDLGVVVEGIERQGRHICNREPVLDSVCIRVQEEEKQSLFLGSARILPTYSSRRIILIRSNEPRGVDILQYWKINRNKARAIIMLDSPTITTTNQEIKPHADHLRVHARRVKHDSKSPPTLHR